MTVHGPWITDALSTYLAGKTVKALLVTSAHAPSPDTVYRSSITGEISGTGYTAGGVVVSDAVVSWNATLDRVVFTCNEVDFGEVNAPDVAGIVFYISTGNAATDRVLSTDMFDAEVAEGALSYAPSTDGVILIVV